MAIRAVVQTPAQIAAEVRRTGEVIPSKAVIGARTLGGLSDVSFSESAENWSVPVWNSTTSTFSVIRHPLLDHEPGTLTADSAVIVDSDSHIDYLNVSEFRIQTAGADTSYIDEIVESITGSASNNQLATAYAVKTYVDDELDIALANIDGGTY